MEDGMTCLTLCVLLDHAMHCTVHIVRSNKAIRRWQKVCLAPHLQYKIAAVTNHSEISMTSF